MRLLSTSIKKQKTSVSEDEIKRANDKIQTLTDEYTKKIDDMVAEKEKEILKI